MEDDFKHACILGSGFAFFVGEYINRVWYACHKTKRRDFICIYLSSRNGVGLPFLLVFLSRLFRAGGGSWDRRAVVVD